MQDILKLFLEKGFLLDGEMLNFFRELQDEELAKEIIEKIAIVSNTKLITKDLVNQNVDKIKPLFFELDSKKKRVLEKFFVNISISVEIRKEVEEDQKSSEPKILKNRFKIISSPVLPSRKLEVKDFVKHFKNRYIFLRDILKQRKELESLTSIDKISTNRRNFSVIGIVTDKRVTKNKNLLLEIEDLTGKVKLLLNQNKEELFEKSKEILLDDVIGFKCSGSREFLFANDLFYPDSFLNKRSKSKEEVYALFISDIHLGSLNFLENNFNRFIDWVSGKNLNSENKRLIEKIRYLFIVGDSVDGVGAYPGQEKDLKIKDIKKQYEKLAEFYKKIPKYISIIQCAGQHDAVRVAEPQPPIGEDFAEPLCSIDNLYLVSNPSLIELESYEGEGIKVLMYHGASMHAVINEVEELRLNNAHSTPAMAVKHLLLRRHLAPSHGNAVYIPNAKKDSMLITEVPDVITTGDLHKLDIDRYNNTLIISNSCWQSITAYEEKMGNQPDYCKVPILNLKTGAVKILDFFEEEEDGDVKDVECEEVEGVKDDKNKKIVCGIENRKKGEEK